VVDLALVEIVEVIVAEAAVVDAVVDAARATYEYRELKTIWRN
jgi:hypothetical protein